VASEDFDFLLFFQEGVISRRQALRHVSEKTLRHRVASGRWQSIHRGIYLTHSGPATVQQRRWIAALAVGDGRGAMLGGPSALAVLGMRGVDTQRIHVLIGVNRQHRRPPPGVVVHRTRRVPIEDQHRMGRPPCTMPARSLVDAAQWAASDRDAAAIIAAGFQQRLVATIDMAPVLARMTHVKRRRLIVEAVADAAGGAESIAEMDFARLCRRHRLPEASRQVARVDSAGRRRYRDVYFDQWRVHVEIDGAQHLEVASWYADMRHHNEIAIAGEILLRFPAWVVRHKPDEVAAQVRAALRAAGWTG
jgi:very-short-patch-repair endonuclease